jgi:hypothetical protein
MSSRRILLALVTAALAVTAMASGADAHLAAFHRHHGWVKYTMLEQNGVTSTEIYIRQNYSQNNSAVWDNSYANGYCYHSGFPGWKTIKCQYWKSNSYPYWVRIDVRGEFHHSVGHDYQQRAYNQANRNNSFVYGCYLEHGTVPWNWSGRCDGGRGPA